MVGFTLLFASISLVVSPLYTKIVLNPEFTPNIDYVRVNELLNKDDVKSNNRNKNNNRFVAENVNNLRNQNRVRAEYAFEY